MKTGLQPLDVEPDLVPLRFQITLDSLSERNIFVVTVAEEDAHGTY